MNALSRRRRSSDVAVFEIDTAAMVTVGHVFHLSDNGVWLTSAVPSGYLSQKRTNP